MAQSIASSIDVVAAERGQSSLRLGAGTAWLAWSLFVATSVACVAAVGLDLHTGTYGTLAYVAATEAIAAIGVLLTTSIPQNRVSWVLAIGALWGAISSLAFAYAVEALVAHPGSLPGGLAAAWLDNWAWLPSFALLLCALLVLMPDGRLLSRRWWPVPASVAVGTVLASLAVSSSTGFDLAGTDVENPLAWDGAAAGVAGIAGALLVVAGLAASLVAFAVRYRRAEGEARQQLRWVVASLCFAVPVAVVGASLWDLGPVTHVLPAVALLAVPAGIAVAVLKYRLFELDLVVNRALVYAVLTVAVVGTYVIVVGLVGSYLSRRGDLVVALAVTGLVAIGFQPLRERVQRFVNRRMYGERDDPYRALAGLGRSLARSLPADAVLPTAVETIARSLALQYVGVTVGIDGGREVAAYGPPTAEALLLPLVHQGVPVGELRLAPRPGERLRERDRRLLADLAPQVAAAVHAVGLSQELQAARRHLVELREEERRRIRRDLHDGLGPALAGLTFTLDAVRNLAGSDRTRADELLASATEQLQAMIVDIRRLIYGLRPPALDQLGLIGALRGLASRQGARVEVAAPDAMPPLEAAVEVAAYRIVEEALTNVTRHARARRCAVRLGLQPKALVLEVTDDGSGFTQPARASDSTRCANGPPSSAGTARSARHRASERPSQPGCRVTHRPRQQDERADRRPDRRRSPAVQGRLALTPRVRRGHGSSGRGS
jgi:signal transduction histidine kinase